MFLNNNNDNENVQNTENKQSSIFSDMITKQNNDNQNQNIFNSINKTSQTNIFKSKTDTKNIFEFNNKSNLGQKTNNIFSTIRQDISNSSLLNINNDGSSSGNRLFNNVINFGNSNLPPANNSLSQNQNQNIFGQHKQIGFGQNNDKQKTNQITFQFGQANNNNNENNSSPFLSLGGNGSLFNNQPQNNNNNNNDNFF